MRLRLQNGETTYANCETNRTIARELGKHLFEPIRIHGTGRWMGEADGTWTLVRFRVHRFDVLAFAWDAQEVRQLRAMLRIGIDAVYCDRPERMVETVNSWTRERSS